MKPKLVGLLRPLTAIELLPFPYSDILWSIVTDLSVSKSVI